MISAVVLILAVIAVMRGGGNATVLKPGKLATPHAQILSGTLTSQRCASCHPQAATSPGKWFASADVGHAGLSQSDRCLNCHHTTIDRPTAKLAHNLSQAFRAELRLTSLSRQDPSWHDLLPGAAVDQEDVQCSVCHREHRGPDGDLLTVSDSQCQTCHSDRFGSFATSHPDWDHWPYGRGRQVSFNHASHASKHFPATVQGSTVAQFQCADCHQRTDDNELTRSTTYQRACQTCHDQALRIETADGVGLVALPMLPDESADKVKPWPESATGFYDGRILPMAELLMRCEPETASALRRLPHRDFSQIGVGSPVAVAAGETIARAHRRLLEEIADHGQQAMMDRISQQGMTPSTLLSFVRSLSPQLVSEANRRWFSAADEGASVNTSMGQPQRTIRPTQFQGLSAPSSSNQSSAEPNNNPRDDLLLTDADPDDVLLTPLDVDDNPLTQTPGGDDELLDGDDLLLGDASQHDPLADATTGPSDDAEQDPPANFDAERLMPAGGWYRDDLRMAIRYRGGGHDDPVLKSTIELISQLPPGDPARQSLLKTRAVAACVACHPGAILSTAHWKSEPLIGRKNQFTKFSHAPHLNVAQLSDCGHCHAIGDQVSSEVSLASGMVDVHDFDPLSRESCTACHTPHAAGDACITCHRYHINLR